MSLSAFTKAVAFIEAMGITVHFRTITQSCFLPGLNIENGELIVDTEQLLYPGDILHEAGHIAVVPANERLTLSATNITERPNREAEEMMAIAWSYAACIHLQLDGAFVFHNQGYQNGGTSILDNFNNRRYFGVSMLQWAGMTVEKSLEDGDIVYPAMKEWLRNDGIRY